MAEYQLIAEPPLAGTDITVGSVHLTASQDMSVVSIALPLGEEDAAQKALKSAFKVALPENGHSVVSADAVRVVRTGPDQAFIVLPEYKQRPERFVSDKLKATVYTTDQSDVWTSLNLEGSGAQSVLERICPLDLDESAFPIDCAARTMMEHLGVLIIRTGASSFLLLSATSSAGSFLHMIETSMRHAI